MDAHTKLLFEQVKALRMRLEAAEAQLAVDGSRMDLSDDRTGQLEQSVEGIKDHLADNAATKIVFAGVIDDLKRALADHETTLRAMEREQRTP